MTTPPSQDTFTTWGRSARLQLGLPFSTKPGRIGLVACCSRKLDHPAPARELYCSRLFKAAVAWLEASTRCGGWAILSAKYGLVDPDQVIEPYDLYLGSLRQCEREAWAERTRAQLLERYGDDTIFLVLAGWEYKQCLSGLMVEDPVAYWTRERRERGMSSRRAALGVGQIYSLLSKRTPYP